MKRYEQLRQELEILGALTRGEREIEAEMGFDIDAVFAEADKLIEGEALPVLLDGR